MGVGGAGECRFAVERRLHHRTGGRGLGFDSGSQKAPGGAYFECAPLYLAGDVFNAGLKGRFMPVNKKALLFWTKRGKFSYI